MNKLTFAKSVLACSVSAVLASFSLQAANVQGTQVEGPQLGGDKVFERLEVRPTSLIVKFKTGLVTWKLWGRREVTSQEFFVPWD